jgi:hypothetical protein
LSYNTNGNIGDEMTGGSSNEKSLALEKSMFAKRTIAKNFSIINLRAPTEDITIDYYNLL